MNVLPGLLAIGMTVALVDDIAAAPSLRDRALAANCTGCHGTEGRSAGGIPGIAGVDRELILTALREFRDGQRPATVMHQHAKGYSDAEFERLADYFSIQRVD
jgi:cytochrome c553